jgi:hypothetical protein
MYWSLGSFYAFVFFFSINPFIFFPHAPFFSPEKKDKGKKGKEGGRRKESKKGLVVRLHS